MEIYKKNMKILCIKDTTIVFEFRKVAVMIYKSEK